MFASQRLSVDFNVGEDQAREIAKQLDCEVISWFEEMNYGVLMTPVNKEEEVMEQLRSNTGVKYVSRVPYSQPK